MSLEAPYLVFMTDGEQWSCYLHVRTGQGRAARRRLVGVWRGYGRLTKRSLPAVLRDVARQMESPVPLHSGHVSQGPGAPQGQ